MSRVLKSLMLKEIQTFSCFLIRIRDLLPVDWIALLVSVNQCSLARSDKTFRNNADSRQKSILIRKSNLQGTPSQSNSKTV
jgi:hypothetical protein